METCLLLRGNTQSERVDYWCADKLSDYYHSILVMPKVGKNVEGEIL